MRQAALRKTEALLDDVVVAIHEAVALITPETVHKLRVSIRRLQQALRVFRQYLPEAGIEKVKKRLKVTMTHAGELRNHDIALELLTKHGDSNPVPQIQSQRTEAERQLTQVLHQITTKDVSIRWRTALGLVTS